MFEVCARQFDAPRRGPRGGRGRHRRPGRRHARPGPGLRALRRRAPRALPDHVHGPRLRHPRAVGATSSPPARSPTSSRASQRLIDSGRIREPTPTPSPRRCTCGPTSTASPRCWWPGPTMPWPDLEPFIDEHLAARACWPTSTSTRSTGTPSRRVASARCCARCATGPRGTGTSSPAPRRWCSPRACRPLSGAVFWLIAARVDTQTDVGHATALFTSVLFVAFVGRPRASRWPPPATPPGATRDDHVLFAWGALATTVASAVVAVAYLGRRQPDVRSTSSRELARRRRARAVRRSSAIGTALSLLLDVRLMTQRRWGLVLARAAIVGRRPLPAAGPARSTAHRAVWLLVVAAAAHRRVGLRRHGPAPTRHRRPPPPRPPPAATRAHGPLLRRQLGLDPHLPGAPPSPCPSSCSSTSTPTATPASTWPGAWPASPATCPTAIGQALLAEGGRDGAPPPRPGAPGHRRGRRADGRRARSSPPLGRELVVTLYGDGLPGGGRHPPAARGRRRSRGRSPRCTSPRRGSGTASAPPSPSPLALSVAILVPGPGARARPRPRRRGGRVPRRQPRRRRRSPSSPIVTGRGRQRRDPLDATPARAPRARGRRRPRAAPLATSDDPPPAAAAVRPRSQRRPRRRWLTARRSRSALGVADRRRARLAAVAAATGAVADRPEPPRRLGPPGRRAGRLRRGRPRPALRPPGRTSTSSPPAEYTKETTERRRRARGRRGRSELDRYAGELRAPRRGLRQARPRSPPSTRCPTAARSRSTTPPTSGSGCAARR